MGDSGGGGGTLVIGHLVEIIRFIRLLQNEDANYEHYYKVANQYHKVAQVE